MRHFSVVHQYGESAHYEVVLEEVSFWCLAVSAVADALCCVTRHRFCHLFGPALFLADDHARALHRFSISAVQAEALGARLPEYEDFEADDLTD